MNLLVIGDAHFKISNLDAARKFLAWLSDYIVDNRPDMVVNLGDLFDNHAVLRAEIMGEYYSFLKFVCERFNTPYYHILGNHEWFRPNSDAYHALQSMKDGIKNLTVVDKRLDHGMFTFVPYCLTPDAFPLDVKPIVFAHQTFVGADFGNGFRPDTGVNADLITGADIIISGHIHKRQSFGKVYYPGSAFAQGVDDVDQQKGVTMFNPITLKYSLVESPMPRWRSFTAVVGGTMHEELLKELTADDHWILNISGPRAELMAYLDSPRFKKVQTSHSVRVRTQYLDGDKERVKIKAITADDAINQYVDQVYSGDLDRELLKRRAIEMLTKTKA